MEAKRLGFTSPFSGEEFVYCPVCDMIVPQSYLSPTGCKNCDEQPILKRNKYETSIPDATGFSG